MAALLDARDLEAAYGRLRVLRGVSLAVPEGGLVAVLGPNGAGKSTLLKVLAGLIVPTAGRVRFDGNDVTGMGAAELARRGVCLIPEGRGIFPRLTVRENIAVASRSASKVDEAIALFPVLGERLGQVAGTLSGGEQQMLAVARAILTSPRLLLLDELSLGLAPRVVDALFDVVARMHATGCTVVLVEQYVDRALALAQLVVILEGGAVRFAGEPGELAESGEGLDAYLGRDDTDTRRKKARR